MIRSCWLTCCFLVSGAVHAQPLLNAHAHNDYRHPHPLMDALQYGFTSVEADVHLVRERILVSHGRPGRHAKTLADHYLKPLDSILAKQSGRVYPDYAGPFYLMIDLKTNGETIFAILVSAIQQHHALAEAAKDHRVIIYLSGNRPIQLVTSNPVSGIALDGRPDDVGKGYSSEVMPVVSDNYHRWSTWNGIGVPAPGQLEKVRKLADAVHRENKKLRLWAIPDQENAWRELLNAGVDFINTDHLPELARFLKSIR